MSGHDSRIVVVGNRNLARHVLVHLLNEGWNVVGAVGAAGSAARRQAGFVPFDETVESHGIELVETENINDEESRKALANIEPDICICPGWHQIIDPSVLEIPTNGFLGFHSSDLPRGRGGAPINWSIIHGENEISVCLFRYTPGVDAGEIVAREAVPAENRDDVSTVIDRLAVAACDALDSVREEIEDGRVETTPQKDEEATYRPRRQPQDGIVDWNSTTDEIRDWIRAQTDPYPGAYTFFEDGKLTVWSVMIPERTEKSDAGEPGTVTGVIPQKGVDVATSDGTVRLRRVQPEGSPRMWADEFARRYDIEDGHAFGKQHAPSSWIYTGIRDENGGTDFSDATNLSVGEEARVNAVVSTKGTREVEVRALLDGTELTSEKTHIEGEERIQVSCRPEESGTHTLAVEFHEGGERIDVRYLKLFVH